jgi:Tfp pilus assembly PilM family ATPase
MASNFVAIEFEKSEIRVAACQTQGKQVRVRAAFQITHSEDDTDSQISEKLKSAMSKNGVGRSEAIIVINRGDAEIRELTAPPVPDNELPSLVRFKSKSEFATATDNWSIDFLTLSGSDSSERELLAMALPGTVSERLSSIADSAGLKVKHIVMRPLATLDLLHSEVGEKLSLIVDPNGDSVDLTLVNEGRMILTRSVRSNANGDLDRLFKQLTMEAQRTLASATKRIGNRSLEKVVICGEEQRYLPLGKTLEDRLQASVSYVNPFSQINLKNDVPQSPERYASLVGALMNQGLGRKHQIDFLNPRQPVVEGGNYQKKLVIAGVLAAVVLAGVFLGWRSLNQQQKKIDALNKQLGQLQMENSGRGEEKGVEQVIGEVEKVDFWLASTPNWLDQLELVSNNSIDSDHVIIDKFAGSIGNDSPAITFKCRMDDQATAGDLKKGLAKFYNVQPSTTQAAESKDYQASLSQMIDIPIVLETTQTEIDQRATLLIDGPSTLEEETEIGVTQESETE